MSCPNDDDGTIDLEDPVNKDYNSCTVCTGDKSNNIWFVNGKCKLDQLTYEQVQYILSRVPQAKKDLLRITTDPKLLDLANSTKPINQEALDDAAAVKRLHRNTLPFYTVLRGNLNGLK